MKIWRPQVSVVIPTWNRPDLLERCLLALRRQTIGRDDYEIIVCDDGPSARTRALVDSMAIATGGKAAHRVRGRAGHTGSGRRAQRGLACGSGAHHCFHG